MISLTCTSCKRGLEIDDAFAGGVCRCQYCGTIQTVPAGLKQGGRPSTPIGKSPTVQKTLYQKQSAATRSATATGVQPEMPPTTMAEPPRTARAAQPGPAAASSRGGGFGGVSRNTWLIGIGIAAAFLIGIIAWLAM
jgi:hypothetical protein